MEEASRKTLGDYSKQRLKSLLERHFVDYNSRGNLRDVYQVRDFILQKGKIHLKIFYEPSQDQSGIESIFAEEFLHRHKDDKEATSEDIERIHGSVHIFATTVAGSRTDDFLREKYARERYERGKY